MKPARVQGEIEKALASFSKERGAGLDDETKRALVTHIFTAIQPFLEMKHAKQRLLVDWDEAAKKYTNPRLTDDEGSPEEVLYPLKDDDSDEPVEKAIADYLLCLPHPDEIPEM